MRTGTPVGSKSETFRVTTIKRCRVRSLQLRDQAVCCRARLQVDPIDAQSRSECHKVAEAPLTGIELLMLMIWSSRARNRSPSLVVCAFFGRLTASAQRDDGIMTRRLESKSELASFRRFKPRKLAVSKPLNPPKIDSVVFHGRRLITGGDGAVECVRKGMTRAEQRRR